MKKFLSVLLSILFGIALLGTLLLGIAKKHIQPSTVTDLASELFKPTSNPVSYKRQNNGLYYPGERQLKVASYDSYYGLEGLDFSNLDFENLDFAEIVNTIAEQNGLSIDSEFISEILSDSDTAALVNEYTNEIVDYMTGTSTELNIDSSKLENVVNKTIDKYEAKTGEVIDRTGLSEIIDEGVKSAVPEITSSLDVVREENAANLEILKKVFEILSLKTLLICIAICVVLAGIIFAINRNIFIMFRYVSIPGITVGLLLFIVSVISMSLIPTVISLLKTEFTLPESLINVAVKLIKTIINDIKLSGFITTITGTLLCVLGFTLYKKAKK